MLFTLSPQTNQCLVFDVLNKEVLHFLQKAITATDFTKDLFTSYSVGDEEIQSVCWSNKPTNTEFKLLWELLPARPAERQQLFDLVNGAQNIAIYFDDEKLPLPTLASPLLFEAFKSLTTHLFTRTKDLNGAKTQAKSSIEQHFQELKRCNNNSQLCYLCGTTYLSQDRPGLDDDDQWRADYDHVLCKDKYPIYSVHPGNFIPTCHICNSKAKGARDLLKLPNGRRRTAFYPLPPAVQSCHEFATVTPKLIDSSLLQAGEWNIFLEITVQFLSAPPDISKKIDVWRDIYQVPARVEQELTTRFWERVDSDLRARSLNDFYEQLERFAIDLPLDYKSTEWRFWWHRVYENLYSQDNDFLRDVWSVIQWKRGQISEEDIQATYGLRI